MTSELAGSGKFFANFIPDEPGLFIYFLVSGWLVEEEVLEVFPYLVEVMKLARVVFLNVTQSAVLLTLSHVDYLFIYSWGERKNGFCLNNRETSFVNVT